MTKMVGKTRGLEGAGGGGGGGIFGRVKTGPGERILRVTRPNGKCSQN